MASKKLGLLQGRKKVKVIVALAERGWICHYCRAQLTKPDDLRFDPTTKTFGTIISWTTPVKVFFGITGDVITHPEHIKLPTIDHKRPRSLGGDHHGDNLILACADCNARKGNRYTYEEFVELMRGTRQ